MQELRAIVNVDEIVIPSLDVDGQVPLSNPACVSNRSIGRIVRCKQIRIPLRPNQPDRAARP
ncbi:MAG: hypothetical protein ABSG56_02585 [Bryobacteraceae bacterium]|jgi:hypothetical protein